MRLFADVHIVLPDVATNNRFHAIVDGRKIDRKGDDFPERASNGEESLLSDNLVSIGWDGLGEGLPSQVC